MIRADRSSLVRVYIGDGVPDDGTAEEGWKYAANLDRLNSDGTYYGDPMTSVVPDGVMAVRCLYRSPVSVRCATKPQVRLLSVGSLNLS